MRPPDPHTTEAVARDRFHRRIGTRVAVRGHPLHPMFVHFPIALGIGTLGLDALYWALADPFFARAALWSAGGAFALGVLAAAVGLAELLSVPGMRRRPEPWSHAVAALALLAVLAANWGVRWPDEEAAVLPWGLYLSSLGFLLTAVAGFQGGALVYEHQFGVGSGPAD